MGRHLQIEDWGSWYNWTWKLGLLPSSLVAAQPACLYCLPSPQRHHGATPQKGRPREHGLYISPYLPGALFNLSSCPATLQKADPLKVYPQLKGTFPENLKKLKRTMEGLDWKVGQHFPVLVPPLPKARAGLGRGEVKSGPWRPFSGSWRKLTRT